ncbi:glycosyltransferase [Clostridium perfringens]|uniref:glycosyltransferase n=1 Tax=Clostridium perfringens TaxID=1502 RepID=UPI0013E3EBB3|nr:glycosyltransferase [Clostridium perfringens]NGT74344.1 glycosyltransferase [Clostridium perfringens]
MKKKILFVIWSFSAGGGAERILANIANNLDESKYEISILEFENFNIRKEEINKNIKVLDPILKSYYRDKKIKNIYYKLIYFLAKNKPYIIRKFFIKDNYDVEISFNYMIPSFIVSTKKNAKKLCWVHSSIEDLDYRNDLDKKEIVKKMNLNQKKAFENIDNIIPISNATEKSIENLYPDFKDKIIKIYNGYEFEKILTFKDEKIKFNKENQYILIAVGRLVKQKNFLFLIDVAKKLKEKNVDFKLLIIGEGEEREKIEEKIKKYNLYNNVELLGYINNPYPYFKKADLFCLTSEAEGFPTVIVESMILGCPFVSTKVAGVDELSSNNECGIVLESDANIISDKIKELLNDSDLRKKMSLNCVKKAREYSLERQIKNIERLID